MEYEIDSENIEIIIKEDKHKISNEEMNLFKLSSPPTNAFDSPNNHFTRYEILLKLNDIYFIENLKIIGEAEDLNINKIKFQNVINNIWETAAFYNTDTSEILVKKNDSIQIFSVGLTQSIKIEVIILSEFNSQRTITGTDLDANARQIAASTQINNLSNFEISAENRNSYKSKNNNNINNNNQMATYNINNNNNLKNSLSNSNSNKNQNFSSRVYNVLPIINSIKKLVVHAQYLYTIPNSTVLMNLINLNNFFLNKSKSINRNNTNHYNYNNNNDNNFSSTAKSNNLNNKNINNNSNNNNNNYNINFSNIANPNYLISLFLSATCMTQSRLFIQAWELLNKMQSILLCSEDEVSTSITFSIIFRQQNFGSNTRHNFFNVKSSENSKHCVAAKLEVIKSACLFEHGQTQPFLDSLLTAINIYYSSDYTNIKKGINWSKINDYNSDKFFVQNFLAKNGKKIIEFLLFCLNDKCEILVISALKIIEYVIDYQPAIITGYFPKIIKSLLRMIYPISKLSKDLDPKNPLSIDGFEYEDFYNFLAKNKEFDEFIQIFTNKDNYFPKELLLKFISVNFHNNAAAESNKKNYNNNNFNFKNNSNYNESILNYNNNFKNNNTSFGNGLESKTLSSVLIKQVNYTLDTIINNIDNLCFSEVNNIFVKSNRLLIEILKYDLDNITMFNVIKLVRKIYENVNAAAGDLGKSVSRSNKTEKQYSELISAILTISVNPKIILKEISEVFNFKNFSKAVNNNNENNKKGNKYNENSFSRFVSQNNNSNISNNNYRNSNNKNSSSAAAGFNSVKFFELFENSEKSNAMLFALERLSEINFLSYAESVNCENLNWIKLNIEILVKYMKKNIESFTGNIANSNINNNSSSNANSKNIINNNNNNNGNSNSNIINNSNSILTNTNNNNNNAYLNSFCIFYLYANLNILKILFLEREDIKFNSIFQLKFQSNMELIKPLLSLVNSLIELQEICLRVKDCFFVFDIVMETLASLKLKFSEFFEFNFNKIFLPQLNLLKNRMLEYGIFKENTYFLDKVLPFIQVSKSNNITNNEEKQSTVKILKEIFEVVLNNFANFYDEEIFIVYNQLLDKLSEDLDQDLIMKIIKSIIFKYNYKGQNFKISTKKLFELFANKINYFKIFKNEIANSTKNIFLNSLVTESLQVNKASGSSISVGLGALSNNQQVYEYLEKLELYKKFVEYLKDNYKSIDKKEHEVFECLFFFSVSQQSVFNPIYNCFNETAILRWLEISSITLDLLEIIINLSIIDKDELEKYLDILVNCINETIPIIANSIKLNNLFINQENFKLLTKFAQMTNYLLEKSQIKFFEFENENKNSIFKIINFNTNNNSSSSSGNVNNNSNNANFDAFGNNNFNNFVGNNNLNASNSKMLDLTFIKTHIYAFIYKSIGNAHKIKDVVNFKTFTNEIMNFLEAIILKHNDFNQESNALSVFSDYFNSILKTYINTQDDLYLIFCLEIIIKFYDIRFEDNSEENKEEFKEDFFSSNKISNSLKNLIPKPIWEKIFLLTEHPNFKLNIFSNYVINYLKPDHLTDKMQEKANYVRQKTEELIEIKNYFNDKFGILTVKKIPENNLNNINNIVNNANLHISLNSLNIINSNSNINSNINNINNFANQMNNLLIDSNNFRSVNFENTNLINNPNNNFNGLQQQLNSAEPLENLGPKSLWYSESEMQSLKNYIKEKIIGIGKLRNDISNVFKSLSPYEEKDELDFSGRKHPESELTEDIDFIEVIQENENFEEEEENFEAENNEENFEAENLNFNNFSKCKKNKNSQLQQQQLKNIYSNKQQQNKNEAAFYYDKERDEYLDLAELGVLEVDDDIFENFDEENIPVIKNIYKRKKGSAEKFKTNQSNRNIFLSSQNNQNAPNNNGTNSSNSASTNPINSEGFSGNKNNNIAGSIGNGNNKKIYSNSNSERFGGEDDIQSARNYEAKRIQKDFNNPAVNSNRKPSDKFLENVNLDTKDLQIKKKNKRPINGLRPSTPPVKQNEEFLPAKQTQQQQQLEEAIPIQYEKKQIASRNQQKPICYSNNNNNLKKKSEINSNFISKDNRKNKQIINTDDPSHKYEIKSMEDLFLDADNFSDNDLFNNPEANLNYNREAKGFGNPVNTNNNEYFLSENEKNEMEEENDNDNDNEKEFVDYDELALNSFENLNLEDFKRGTSNALQCNNNNINNNVALVLESKNKNVQGSCSNNVIVNSNNNNNNINNGSFNLKKLKIKTDFNDFENELVEENEIDNNDNMNNIIADIHNVNKALMPTEENKDLLSNENNYNFKNNNKNVYLNNQNKTESDDSPLIESENINNNINNNKFKILIDDLNNNINNYVEPADEQEDILIQSEDYFNNYPAEIKKNIMLPNEKNIYEYADIDNKIFNLNRENNLKLNDFKEEEINNDELANEEFYSNKIGNNKNNNKNINKANFINRMRIHTHDSMENFMEKNDENLIEDQIELEEKALEINNDDNDYELQQQVSLENEEFYKGNPYHNNSNYNSKRLDKEFDLQYANSKNALFNKTMNFNPSSGFNKNFHMQNLDVNEYNNNKTDNNYYIDYNSMHEMNNNNNNNKNPNNNPHNNSQSDSLPIADDYVGEDVFDENALDNIKIYDGCKKSKIDFQREVKSKRPPTRYGNREDQVLWEKNKLQQQKQQQQNNMNLISFDGVTKNNQSDKHENNKNLKHLFPSTEEEEEELEFDNRVKGESIKNKTLQKNGFSNKNKNFNYNNFLNNYSNSNIEDVENVNANFNVHCNNKKSEGANFFSTNPKLNDYNDNNNNNNTSKNRNFERRLNPSNTQKNLEIKISDNNFTNAKCNTNKNNFKNINNQHNYKNEFAHTEEDPKKLNRSYSSFNKNNNNNNNTESFDEQHDENNYYDNNKNEEAELSNRDSKYRMKTLHTANDEFNNNNTNNNRISSNNDDNENNVNKNINKTNLDNNLNENLEASDFRKTLRAQLSKNHNKIFANLKKLYMNNDLKNPDSGKNSNLYSMKNKSKSPGNANTNKPNINSIINNNNNGNKKISDCNANIKKTNNNIVNKNKSLNNLNKNAKEEKFIKNNQEQEDYVEAEQKYYTEKEPEFLNYHRYTNRNDSERINDDGQGLDLDQLKTNIIRTQSNPDQIYSERDSAKNKNKASQNTSHVINTNLTESKYLVASTNKTPNFNYTVYKNN